jgi:hypothetical protein
LKCYSVPWWSEVVSSVTVTEFILVASVESINSSLPLAMSDLGLDTKMCLKIWTAMCFLVLGIFLKLMDRKDRINVIHFYVFGSYMILLIVERNFVVMLYISLHITSCDNGCPFQECTSMFLTMLIFYINSAHSRWTGVKLNARFVSVCCRIFYSVHF